MPIVMEQSEVVNESGASEQAAEKRPIKTQSTAVARATASICNAEWTLLGGMSGRGGFVHSFSPVNGGFWVHPRRIRYRNTNPGNAKVANKAAVMA